MNRTLNLLSALSGCSGERTKTQNRRHVETDLCVESHAFFPVSLGQGYKNKQDDDLESILM